MPYNPKTNKWENTTGKLNKERTWKEPNFELLALYEDKDRPSRDVKKIAMNKIADIDRRLGELRQLKSELAALAQACDGDDRPHCPIIDGLAGTRC